MAIEIKELVIKTVVTDKIQEKDTISVNDLNFIEMKESILKECIEIVLEKIEDQLNR